MRTEKTTLTNICTITSKNKLLVEQRTNKNWAVITFPGGHVEPKESFVDSVAREVYEQTGLTIYDPVLCGVKQFTTEDDGRYIVFLYKTSKFTGHIKSSSESEVFWIDQEDLFSTKLASGFKEMYEIFTTPSSELYYFEDNGNWQTQIK